MSTYFIITARDNGDEKLGTQVYYAAKSNQDFMPWRKDAVHFATYEAALEAVVDAEVRGSTENRLVTIEQYDENLTLHKPTQEEKDRIVVRRMLKTLTENQAVVLSKMLAEQAA